MDNKTEDDRLIDELATFVLSRIKEVHDEKTLKATVSYDEDLNSYGRYIISRLMNEAKYYD